MSQEKNKSKYAVSTSVIIDATRLEVWNVLQDFANVADWAPTVSHSNVIGKAEKGVGHGRHCKIDGFGGIDEFITLWEENRGFEYDVSALGPLAESKSSWVITETGNGKARLSISLNYNTRFGLLGTIMHAMIMRKKLEMSIKDTGLAVKNHVESLALKTTNEININPQVAAA
jgi:hypothetical protein